MSVRRPGRPGASVSAPGAAPGEGAPTSRPSRHGGPPAAVTAPRGPEVVVRPPRPAPPRLGPTVPAAVDPGEAPLVAAGRFAAAVLTGLDARAVERDAAPVCASLGGEAELRAEAVRLRAEVSRLQAELRVASDEAERWKRRCREDREAADLRACEAALALPLATTERGWVWSSLAARDAALARRPDAPRPPPIEPSWPAPGLATHCLTFDDVPGEPDYARMTLWVWLEGRWALDAFLFDRLAHTETGAEAGAYVAAMAGTVVTRGLDALARFRCVWFAAPAATAPVAGRESR